MKKITCRGRNGYFTFDHFDVLGGLNPYYLSIYSKAWKETSTAPIQLVGDKESLIELLESMIRTIKVA